MVEVLWLKIQRLRYYQGSIDLDLISKGEDYRKLTKSYIILRYKTYLVTLF